jgi:hypothetical protein
MVTTYKQTASEWINEDNKYDRSKGRRNQGRPSKRLPDV